RPFGGELGVRDVADVAEAALVEAVTHPQSRPDRHRALHYHRRLAELRHLVGLQRHDPLALDVADHDVVSELREAGTGHEPDIAGAEDGNCTQGAPTLETPRASDPWQSPASSRSRGRRAASSRSSTWPSACAARPCAGSARSSGARSGDP